MFSKYRVPVTPSDLPITIGPFSYGILDDKTIYVSGTLSADSDWKVVGKGDVVVQTEHVFERIEKVLKAADFSLDDVVKMNVYLLNAEDYKPMNEVRKRFFTPPYPASTVVIVKELILHEALVEIDVIARRH